VQDKHGRIFLAQSKLIAIWLLLLAELNLLSQVESPPRMIVFVTFGQEFSRVLHTFGTDTSNWKERRCVRDAQARRRLRGSCSFNPSQKLTRREAPLFEICAAEIFSPASGVLTSSLGVRVCRFFGAVGQGVRCRLMFSWWCVWLKVRRLFGFVLGGNRFLQCNDAKVEISILLLLCFMKWTL